MLDHQSITMPQIYHGREKFNLCQAPEFAVEHTRL
jgi:hypothetical protein